MLEWAAAIFNLFEGFNERSCKSFRGLRDFLNKFGKPAKMQHGGLASRIFDQAPSKSMVP